MIRAAQARAARKRYRQIAPILNEQSRRWFVAMEARALGRSNHGTNISSYSPRKHRQQDLGELGDEASAQQDVTRTGAKTQKSYMKRSMHL
jgi:hypothetical protein